MNGGSGLGLIYPREMKADWTFVPRMPNAAKAGLALAVLKCRWRSPDCGALVYVIPSAAM